jgi:hypothetical protein
MPNGNQQPVMAPAQFVTQCVTIWECEIKQAHVPQIGFGESLSQISCQLNRQGRNQSIPIRRFCCAALLFDNHFAHEPVRLDHREVGSRADKLPRLLKYIAHLAVKCTIDNRHRCPSRLHNAFAHFASFA